MNTQLEVEGLGTIENMDILITWIGITEKKGKLCAIIQFHEYSTKF